MFARVLARIYNTREREKVIKTKRDRKTPSYRPSMRQRQKWRQWQRRKKEKKSERDEDNEKKNRKIQRERNISREKKLWMHPRMPELVFPLDVYTCVFPELNIRTHTWAKVASCTLTRCYIFSLVHRTREGECVLQSLHIGDPFQYSPRMRVLPPNFGRVKYIAIHTPNAYMHEMHLQYMRGTKLARGASGWLGWVRWGRVVGQRGKNHCAIQPRGWSMVTTATGALSHPLRDHPPTQTPSSAQRFASARSTNPSPPPPRNPLVTGTSSSVPHPVQPPAYIHWSLELSLTGQTKNGWLAGRSTRAVPRPACQADVRVFDDLADRVGKRRTEDAAPAVGWARTNGRTNWLSCLDVALALYLSVSFILSGHRRTGRCKPLTEKPRRGCVTTWPYQRWDRWRQWFCEKP